jgi:hypothetical protein
MTYFLPRSSLLQPAVARVNSRIGRWGVGRGNGRSRFRVRTPPRRIRARFRGYKHTSLVYLDLVPIGE